MHQNVYLIGIILIVIVIIVVLLWIFLDNKSKNKTSSSMDISEMVEKSNINLEEINRKSKTLRGELYSPCYLGKDRESEKYSELKGERKGEIRECKDGLVCDNGLCKQASGESCVISSSCNSRDICYIGNCTPQPQTKEEFQKTNYGGGRICVNRHFLKLKNDSFAMLSGWWSMNGGIDICDSDVTGLVYVVREEGIFRISADPVISGLTKIKQNLSISKIFRFMDKIHVLTNNGIFYQLINETISSKWKYRLVTEIYKKEITSSVIEDIYPCKDGSISIRISGKTFSYSIRNKKWTEEPGKPIKIIYGSNTSTRITLYNDKICYYFTIKNKNKEPIQIRYELKGSFKDTEFNINGNAIIVISAGDDIIREYKPVIWHSFASPTSPRGGQEIQNHFRERLIRGSGDRLIRTRGIVWLLTGATCSPI